jgi:hypothetical protein
MTNYTPVFLVFTVLIAVVFTEVLLFLCWRTFGDRGAYPWYSCILRTVVYSPCIAVGAQGLAVLPLGSAVFLNLRGAGNQIIWLYGLPEIFVGMVCFFISFGIRLINSPAR